MSRAHPTLPPGSAVALTLRAVGGLSTRQIATAYLVPEATMAQRISRGGQIASRYSLIRTHPFPFGTADERAAWQALVAILEDALGLHAHRRGTPLRLSGYLHETHQRNDRQPVPPRPRGRARRHHQPNREDQPSGLDAADLDQSAEHHRATRQRRRRTNRQTAAT